mmetsp:Transcript_54319/g.151237  ORF Transcript_54319/g.151237 Transcript_54319/m.151237 type:complete len:257 (+) Transcript_54319:85-855(+)
MMYPNPDYVPLLVVAKSTLRESRFIDVELGPESAEPFGELGIRPGDVVALSAAPVEPDAPAFVVEALPRKGLSLTVSPSGFLGEEGRICSRQLLTGSKYTILADGRVGEFTVHRHVSIEGTDQLKLHFAHGSQILKLSISKGSAIKIKEKPCGVEDWTVLEVHTENLERCPNCRTGLKGPRSKEFNASDLCAPGTQWALVRPTHPPPKGVVLYGERKVAVAASPAKLRLVARPDPRHCRDEEAEAPPAKRAAGGTM